MESKRFKNEVIQLGENIRAIRAKNGLSQFDLEAICGIDRGDISRIENGRLDIQLSTIVKLAEALDVPTKDLFKPIAKQ